MLWICMQNASRRVYLDGAKNVIVPSFFLFLRLYVIR